LKARKHQTLAFVKKMRERFAELSRQMEIWEIIEDLNNLVDVSDPDSSHPNLHHALQTAEMMRKDGLPDWMILTGLLHDIGKIMYKRGSDSDGTGREEQWAMVGDTFVVGCRLPDALIFPEYNQENPDMSDSRYQSELGIYQPKCGLDQVYCSWGHDEYLYQILSSPKNPNRLPEEALYVIRFHSLYAYHEKGAYQHLVSERDRQFFPHLKMFNKYDLYSKCDTIYDLKTLRPYYDGLINKYFTNSYLYI
jgi:inositol oxygenase